jgi:methyltransferase family protein
VISPCGDCRRAEIRHDFHLLFTFFIALCVAPVAILNQTMDFSDYARNYIDAYKSGGFEPILARARRQKVLSCIGGHPHRMVLEVGCGFEPLFADVQGFDEYWIVEPLAEAVKAVKAHPFDERIHVVEGFLEDRHRSLPGDFDFIVLSGLLHEVADPNGMLEIVHLHCGSGSVVHINVPNVNSFHRLLALEAGLINDIFEESEMDRRFQHHSHFDRAGLVEMVENHGFEVLEWGTYFVKPFTHSQMEGMLAAGTIDMRVVEGLNRMTRYLPDLGCEMFVNARLR